MYVKQKLLFSFISSFGPISRSFLYMLSFNCIYLLRFCIHGSFCLSVLFLLPLLPFLYYPLLFTFCSRMWGLDLPIISSSFMNSYYQSWLHLRLFPFHFPAAALILCNATCISWAYVSLWYLEFMCVNKTYPFLRLIDLRTYKKYTNQSSLNAKSLLATMMRKRFSCAISQPEPLCYPRKISG